MRVLVLLALLVGFARPAAADITLGAVTIRDASSNTVGRVDSDGTIRNASSNSVGKIDSDGTIRNSSSNSVGKVDGYSPALRHMVAAVLFFGGSVSVLSL
jgi:hypothetical protein